MEQDQIQQVLKKLAEKAKESDRLAVNYQRQADAARAEASAYQFSHDELFKASGAFIVTPLALPDEESDFDRVGRSLTRGKHVEG